MTWTCQRCGKVLSSEDEYRKHVCFGRTMSKCPECGGSGKKIQAIGPAVWCPRCGGKGKI